MKHSLLGASLLVVISVALCNFGVAGILSLGPCINLGNTWTNGPIERRARPVALYPDNHGHSPFNLFYGINELGNCVDVHIFFQYPVINVTVICRKEHYTSQDKQDAPAQCPKYETGVRWSPADLIYIEYDSYRYELRSCAFMNGTHAYRGYMMLTDLFEPRSRPRLKELPIWKQRVNDPDALLFRYDGDCEKCNFRNEYVGVARPLRSEQDDQPLNVAEPFCVDGHLTMLTSDPRSSSDDKENSFTFGSLSVPLALLVVTLIVIVMMALRSMCIRKSATRVVSPELSERSRKCSLVVERLSAY